MNPVESQLEAVEISIEQAKEGIEMRDALKRLTENADFNKVIKEGYFKEEASRLVLLKADHNMQDEKNQKQLDNSIIAVGYLRQYFQTIFHIGNMAEKAKEADEATRQELLGEAV